MGQEIRELGKYIVSNPGAYGGRPTFRGTRIPVSDVLYFVSKGTSWDEIVWEYDGKVPLEAIAEAVQLAADALTEKHEAALASA